MPVADFRGLEAFAKGVSRVNYFQLRAPSTSLACGTEIWYQLAMQKRHRATLLALYARPVRGWIRWSDIEGLLVALGAEVKEREGSRVSVYLFGEVRVFHRPHPSPDTGKGAVESIRKWLDSQGVRP